LPVAVMAPVMETWNSATSGSSVAVQPVTFVSSMVAPPGSHD